MTLNIWNKRKNFHSLHLMFAGFDLKYQAEILCLSAQYFNIWILCRKAPKQLLSENYNIDYKWVFKAISSERFPKITCQIDFWCLVLIFQRVKNCLMAFFWHVEIHSVSWDLLLDYFLMSHLKQEAGGVNPVWTELIITHLPVFSVKSVASSSVCSGFLGFWGSCWVSGRDPGTFGPNCGKWLMAWAKQKSQKLKKVLTHMQPDRRVF